MDASLQMSGKAVVVTGATDGIGRITALRLAQKGAHVGVVGRNRQKVETVCAALEREAPNGRLEPYVADLSELSQIHTLADEIKNRQGQLSVLVNNAGAMFTSRQVSADGLEMTFALNHLSYYVLTHLLLDSLRADGMGRIVNVSSVAHRHVGVDFADLQMEKSYSGWKAYGRSKLYNLFFTFALARRLEGQSVTVNALHPGFVASEFGNNNTGTALKFLLGLAKKVSAISPEEGARTSLYLATSPDVEGVTGEYFEKCRIAAPSPTARSQEKAERLWEVSRTLTGLG